MLRIVLAFVAVIFMFLGIGELLQGSAMVGAALVGIATLSLFAVFAIKTR